MNWTLDIKTIIIVGYFVYGVYGVYEVYEVYKKGGIFQHLESHFWYLPYSLRPHQLHTRPTVIYAAH